MKNYARVDSWNILGWPCKAFLIILKAANEVFFEIIRQLVAYIEFSSKTQLCFLDVCFPPIGSNLRSCNCYSGLEDPSSLTSIIIYDGSTWWRECWTIFFFLIFWRCDIRHPLDAHGFPFIFMIPSGVGYLKHWWLVEGTTFILWIHGRPIIAL